MQRPIRSPGPVLALGMLLAGQSVTAASTALHDPEVSDDEAKCEQATSAAIGKFAAAKMKCVINCRQRARTGENPGTDCNPSYNGATLACVEGAELIAEDAEIKHCATDCPECYSGAACDTDADRRVRSAEMRLDTVVPQIYCQDGDGNTGGEDLCEDTTAKALGKLAPARSKCLAKCHRSEHQGKIPPASCTAGLVSDPTGKTQACITKASDRARAAIDKACEASGDKPECYGVRNGAAWVALVETIVDDNDRGTFCGSPSGAFVDRSGA